MACGREGPAVSAGSLACGKGVLNMLIVWLEIAAMLFGRGGPAVFATWLVVVNTLKCSHW